MNKLFSIKNGNCNVTLYDNGTRVVETINPEDSSIALEQPLSLDINISNRCSNSCPYCYAGNTPTGKTADLLNMHYLDDITGLEIAINIQYPLPENFELWLEKMKNQNIIVNGTINQLDFERDIDTLYYIKQLKNQGLLHGIGISYRKYNEQLYNLIKDELGNDVVIHTIVGVTSVDDVKLLLDQNFKVLVLGYKVKNRGIDYFLLVDADEWVERIEELLHYNTTSVLAFDTMGLEQLEVKKYLTQEQWEQSYQGDEGSISFYIDAVDGTFNTDSHTRSLSHLIMDLSVKDMFEVIKSKKGE